MAALEWIEKSLRDICTGSDGVCREAQNDTSVCAVYCKSQTGQFRPQAALRDFRSYV